MRLCSLVSLEGRVALITGATGEGIGRSIALTLARDGADVVLNYRSKHERAARVEAAIEAMGRRVLAHMADITDPAAVEGMFAVARTVLGPVDILVNSAGGQWKPDDITDIEPAHFRRVIASEIDAMFLLVRSALPSMRERGWGRIVSIGGYGAEEWRFGPPDAPVDYPLGKAARHWLTRTLAQLEQKHGITINAVAPGPTRHVSLEEALAALEGRPDVERNVPQDIAEVLSFLCSAAAVRVTGAVIPVPGATDV